MLHKLLIKKKLLKTTLSDDQLTASRGPVVITKILISALKYSPVRCLVHFRENSVTVHQHGSADRPKLGWEGLQQAGPDDK